MKRLSVVATIGFIAVALVAFLPVPEARAENGAQVLVTDRDTFIDTAHLTTTYGSQPYLWLSEFETTRHEYQQIIIHFNLSSIPAGATIVSATMSLFMIQCHNQPTNNRFYIANAVNTWPEEMVWAQHPMQGDDKLTANVPVCSSDTWLNFPIDIIVQKWVNGAYTNNGLVLYSAISTPWDRQFMSRETDSAPKLAINYTYTPGSTPTVGTGGNSGNTSTSPTPGKTPAAKKTATPTIGGTSTSEVTPDVSVTPTPVSEDQAQKQSIVQYLKNNPLKFAMWLFLGFYLISALAATTILLIKKYQNKKEIDKPKL